MADTRIKVGFSEETLAKIDEVRGDVPRERWLRRVVEERLTLSTLGEQVRQKLTHPLDSDDRSAAGDGGWSTKVIPATNSGYAGGTKGASKTPVKQPVRKTPPAAGMLDHPYIGQQDRCLRAGCPDPKVRARHLPDPPY